MLKKRKKRYLHLCLTAERHSLPSDSGYGSNKAPLENFYYSQHSGQRLRAL